MNSVPITHAISMIEQIKKLPVLPQVTMRITERMQSPTATLQEIADLIQTDAGLTSKVLRLANSSYYSIPGGVSDVSKALQFLGFTTIAQIVLTTSVLSSFKTTGASYFPLDQFWKHSFAVGLAAEITARNLQLSGAKDAFIVNYARENKVSFIEAERALHLTDHTQLGVQLAEHWKLPSGISSAIMHHHLDMTEEEVTPLKLNHDYLVIAWANQWIHELEIGHSGDYRTEHVTLETELSQKLGLTAKQKDQIQKKFETEFEKAGAILSGHS